MKNIKGSGKRDHDLFYENEDYTDRDSKETFKLALSKIKEYKKDSHRNMSIADFGCASGEFLYHYNKVFPMDDLNGIDILDSSLKVLKKNIPNAKIHNKDVLSKNSFNKDSFDIITAFGFLGCFDDIEPILENFMHWLKPDGYLICHCLINEFNYDVILRYKESDDSQNEMQTGWNIFSQNTIRKILLKGRTERIEFNKFEMFIDLEKKLEDPMRSWTELDNSGNRMITNALHINQPQYFLEVIKGK
ncbi:MAG: hypothetical protein CMC86_07655 [Flavobacteriaceae bacterium]|nr:hypothetical protein [Flavobacteriaceae bacterium]|tara:strand:- start:1428 stop:2168 length:741 start_codon:yes stop_codon:yes gene_type:complete